MRRKRRSARYSIAKIKQERLPIGSVDDKSILVAPEDCKGERDLEHEYCVFLHQHKQNSDRITRHTSNSLVDEGPNEEPDEVPVKQEISEKCEFQLQSVNKNPAKGYEYWCYLCKKKMLSLKVVLDHRRLYHKIKGPSRPRIKHLDLEPDLLDLNHYCKGCEKAMKTHNDYRRHIKTVHHILLKPLPRRRKRGPLDYNSTGFYCSLCSRPFQTQYSFTEHCQLHHDIANPNLRGLPNEPKANFQCQLCNAILLTKQKYRAHCYKLHKMRPVRREPYDKTLPNHCYICSTSYFENIVYLRHIYIMHGIDDESKNRPTDAKPDINDPNNYCRICCKVFCTSNAYKYHLLSLHSIKDEYRKETALKPDVSDPNNHCRACNFTYKSRYAFNTHLRRVHQIKICRTLYDPSHCPDPHDPNNYCSICQIRFKLRWRFRDHCKRSHYMPLPAIQRRFAKPDAEIDVSDPNFYCAKCDKTMYSKGSFGTHLKAIHNLDPPPKPPRKTPYPKPRNATVNTNNTNL